ncbi:hypothetical protein JG687_00010031 [Phytophthora cactorum]|uniref:Uncharacterized protein n=1 Tax=Phytophthora cactorum TaxID=29920 RepID=A0A8T1UC99_9STRA|nr:hypothetical protein JG687_00010031 [Phytophthora cactorum]
MELVKLPAKLVNAWGVVEQQSTVVTTLVMMDTLLWMVSLGEVMETTAKAVAVTVTTQLVRKPLFLVIHAAVVESGSDSDDNERVERIGEVASSPGLFGNSVMYVNRWVAYSPSHEKWLMTKNLVPVFRQVGAAYEMGCIFQRIINREVVLDEVRWLGTMFQKHTHFVSIGVLQRGCEHYPALTRTVFKT